MIAKVAVENTTIQFDKEFDYSVPERLASECEVGRRVLVPFGRGNKPRQGIITELCPSDADGLKEIISVPDTEAVMSRGLFDCARFIKEHCFCTLYEAVRAMLPAGINYRLTTVYGIRSGDESLVLDEEKQRLYNYLFQKKKPVRLERILSDFGYSDGSLLDEMVAQGVLYKSDEAFRRINDAVAKMVSAVPGLDRESLSLTTKQREVLELIELSGAVSVKDIRYFTGVSASVIVGILYYIIRW